MEDKHTTAKKAETKQETIEQALRSLEKGIIRLRSVADRVNLGDPEQQQAVKGTEDTNDESHYVWGYPLTDFLDRLPTHLNVYEEEIRTLAAKLERDLF